MLHGEINGKDLRGSIAYAGFCQKKPSFYLFIMRLEDKGLVTSRYQAILAEKYKTREKIYRLTRRGVQSLEDTVAFFSLSEPVPQ